MPGDRTSKLIAIIDDDEAMQDSLRDLMEAAGLVARCFGSAEEFLESDLHSRAACLIVDLVCRLLLEKKNSTKKTRCSSCRPRTTGGSALAGSDGAGRPKPDLASVYQFLVYIPVRWHTAPSGR